MQPTASANRSSIVTAQMNGGGSATYQYDGEGHRVRKSGSTTTDYLHDLGGRTILELSSATTWTRAEAFAPDGRHLATYSGGPAGTTYFHHSDWLGTERAHTSVGGTLAWACTSEPFGDGSTCTGAEATPPSPAKSVTPKPDSTTSEHVISDRTWGSG